MKKILLFLFLLIGRFSYCQTSIEIINQTGSTKFRFSSIINPYSGTQKPIEEGLLSLNNSIDYQPLQSLEKVVLEIEKQTYSFYVEPNGLYHLTISHLEPLTISLKEKNSSINASLNGVETQFESLHQLKTYFQGTREGTIGWLHLGRSKNSISRSMNIIKRNVKSIKKQTWFYQNNNAFNVALYLVPYTFTEDFKNDNLAGNLAKSETLFKNIGRDIFNPIYAEAFKFFYGYSIRQNFMLNSHFSVKSANSESYVAFRKAIGIINEIEDGTTRQLALLSIYDSYYHSYDFNFGAKKEVIEPGLEIIISNPKHPTIMDYAVSLKNELLTLTIGEEVPDFNLISYNGDSISLSDLQGKYVYLDFWFSRCAPCIKAMRELPLTIDLYQDKVQFVSINSFDSFELGKKLAKENGFVGIKLHAGKNHQILTDYNIQYYPTYYLISPDGKLLYRPVDDYSSEFDNVLKHLDLDERQK